MKHRIGYILLATSLVLSAPHFFVAPLHAQSISQDGPIPVVFDGPTVRVLIAHKSKGALLEVAGRYVLTDPKTNKRLDSGLLGQRLTVRPDEDGLTWGNNQRGVYQFQLAPRSGERFFWVDGVQYKGVLYVYQIGQTLSLVNELTIEDYVASIVQSNSGEDTQPEAANALAICARSDAWYHVKSKPDAYWHLYAPEVGFRGVGGLTEASPGSQAAAATRCLYLINSDFSQNNGFFLSRWTRHSAGHTVAYNQLNPERREAGDFSVESSSALMDRERTQWQSIITQDQIEKSFELAPGSLVDVSIIQDPKTQKVCSLVLKTSGELRQFSYFKAVQALGSDKIRSSEFSVRQLPSHQYQFLGYGEGDGIGLCLYSAQKMAEQGKLAPQILETFFPGSKVELLKTVR